MVPINTVLDFSEITEDGCRLLLTHVKGDNYALMSMTQYVGFSSHPTAEELRKLAQAMLNCAQSMDQNRQ